MRLLPENPTYPLQSCHLVSTGRFEYQRVQRVPKLRCAVAGRPLNMSVTEPDGLAIVVWSPQVAASGIVREKMTAMSFPMPWTRPT